MTALLVPSTKKGGPAPVPIDARILMPIMTWIGANFGVGDDPVGCLSRRPLRPDLEAGAYLVSFIDLEIPSKSLVPQEGFEPPTPSLRMMCSTD